MTPSPFRGRGEKILPGPEMAKNPRSQRVSPGRHRMGGP